MLKRKACEVFALKQGVYLFGTLYKTRSFELRAHAVGYNADTILLALGKTTLLVTDENLQDLEIRRPPSNPYYLRAVEYYKSAWRGQTDH